MVPFVTRGELKGQANEVLSFYQQWKEGGHYSYGDEQRMIYRGTNCFPSDEACPHDRLRNTHIPHIHSCPPALFVSRSLRTRSPKGLLPLHNSWLLSFLHSPPDSLQCSGTVTGLRKLLDGANLELKRIRY